MTSHAPFLSSLTKLVGASNIRVGKDAEPFHQDERNRYHNAPLAVVFPTSTKQISQVVKLCAHQTPPIAIIPQGGNTGLVGGCAVLAEHASILLNLSRMNQVMTVDPINCTLTVQAGTTLENVQHAAAAHDLMFPLSLASQKTASIGGNLATNAGGTQVLRYGNIRDLCLGLEVVLPNGEIWSNLNVLRKNNTGYDLKHLFIGAEGTLGVITSAVLKLFPSAKDSCTTLVATTNLHGILQVFNKIRKQFYSQLTTFEYISPTAMNLVCAQFDYQNPFKNHDYHIALIEITLNNHNNDLNETLKVIFQNELNQSIKDDLIVDAVFAQNSKQRSQFWHLREHLSAAQKRVGKNIKHDISIPISMIEPFVQQTSTTLEQTYPGIEPMIFGHIGDGNLHFNISCGTAFPDSNQLMAHEKAINAIVYASVAQFKGSISAEHGIGLLKLDLMSTVKSSIELALMHNIKNALDPLNIMNPEKIISSRKTP